jgi:hypothetical protein
LAVGSGLFVGIAETGEATITKMTSAIAIVSNFLFIFFTFLVEITEAPF